jgi:hypothetical protein
LTFHRQNLPPLEAKIGKVIHNIKVFPETADKKFGNFLMARTLKSIFQSVCILAALGVPVLHAKDFTVALDVIPAATAPLKSAEAVKTPVIFRSDFSVTNAMAAKFLFAFADARSNFLGAIQDTFHQATLDDQTIASPDFSYFITAFNIRHKNFPLTSDLAATWAHGHPGLTAQNRLLDLLLLTMQHAIRPDESPENLAIGATVRLVPADAGEKLTLNDVEARGKFLAESNIVTLSRVREIFRREFTADEEQPLARALAALLKPNCVPDAKLTQLALDHAVQLGEMPKLKTTLEVIAGSSSEKPAATVANFLPAQNQPAKMPGEKGGALNVVWKMPKRIYWLLAALAGISIFIFFMWRRLNSQRSYSLLPARVMDLPTQNAMVLSAEIAPHLAQVVKDALVQELAVQRRELLVAQQMAAAEISELVRRLDRLQMTMQERLQAYELQIQTLEKELVLRTEENRELLKLKIEMMRQQLEAERERGRVDFN